MGFIYPNFRSLLVLLLFYSFLATSCKASPISPGAFERRVQAYNSAHKVRPLKIFYTEGIFHNDTSQYMPNTTVILKGPGALVTFEFAQNITGRLHLNIDSVITFENQSIGVSLYNSPGQRKSARFLPLRNGTIIEDVPDVFKFATLFVPPRSAPASLNRTETVTLRDIWIAYTDNVESREEVITGEKVGEKLGVVLERVGILRIKSERVKKAKNGLLAGILKILVDSWGK